MDLIEERRLARELLLVHEQMTALCNIVSFWQKVINKYICRTERRRGDNYEKMYLFYFNIVIANVSGSC